MDPMLERLTWRCVCTLVLLERVSGVLVALVVHTRGGGDAIADAFSLTALGRVQDWMHLGILLLNRGESFLPIVPGCCRIAWRHLAVER